MIATLWSIFVLGSLLLIAGAIGDRVVRLLNLLPPDARDSDRLLFSLALGLGSVAFITFGVGMAGVLRPAPLFGTLLVSGLICTRGALSFLSAVGRLALRAGKFIIRLVLDTGRQPYNIWLLIGLCLAGIEAVALFIGALGPPAGADYDALAYHLALPALYLRWGAIRYDPYILHSNFPQITEMLYMVMLAAGAPAARAVHFIFGLLAAGVSGSLSRRYGRAAAIVGMLVFWITPVVAWEASSGYDDLTFAFFQSLGFLSCLRAFDQKESAGNGRWFALAGICQGLALGVKYTALAFVPLLLIAAAAAAWRRVDAASRLRIVLKKTAITGCAAALVASPWYVRTLIWTGNPVFPYYYSLFGGRNWSRAAEQFYRHLQTGYGAGHALGLASGHGIIDFLTAPWHLVAVPQYYYEPGGNALFGVLFGGVGLVYLLFCGLNFINGEWKPAAAGLALLFGAFYIEWYLLMQQVRYLIPALPLLTPACALALAPLFTNPPVPDISPPASSAARTVRMLAALIALASFGWTVWVAGQLYDWGAGPSALLVDVGVISREDYLSERLPDLWPVSEWVNTNLPENARVALISEPRGYYMRRDTLWADGYEQEKLRYSTMRSATDLIEALRKAGIDDVVVRLGSPQGLVEVYGLPHANPYTADWSSLNYHGPLSHWITLYYSAVEQGLLIPIYPQSGAVTDPHGYAIYEVGRKT